jgi:hypothetical protein
MFVPNDVVILALGALKGRLAPEARRITVNYRATTTRKLSTLNHDWPITEPLAWLVCPIEEAARNGQWRLMSSVYAALFPGLDDRNFAGRAE